MKKRAVTVLLITGPLICILITLFIGRYPIPAKEVVRLLAGKILSIIEGVFVFFEKYPISIKEVVRLFAGNVDGVSGRTYSIVWNIRLPRAILGALVGGSLAISGASFQGLFRNPLVNSGILGVSSGAGFGAALAIILFHGIGANTYVFAFLFGTLAVLLSYMISRVYRITPTVMLVLGGVIVSSIFSSLLSFLKFMADPYDQLPTIVFWLMGSLASAEYKDIALALIPMAAGVAGLLAVRWRINVLSMGDKEARALGINTRLNKLFVIACATLATTGAVCLSGIIGWVGLVIPHIARMLVGNDNKVLIPASLSLGACFLVIVDNVCRTISGSEIPIGILTALVGAPFYIYLLRKTKGGGW